MSGVQTAARHHTSQGGSAPSRHATYAEFLTVVPGDPGRVALLALAAIAIGTAATIVVRRRRSAELGVSTD